MNDKQKIAKMFKKIAPLSFLAACAFAGLWLRNGEHKLIWGVLAVVFLADSIMGIVFAQKFENNQDDL